MTKADVLVLAPLAPSDIMDELESRFNCHHVWKRPSVERPAFIDEVGGSVRAVVSDGGLGIRGELVDLLPRLEIVALNGVGVDAVDFAATRARGIHVTNTPDVLTDDVADLAVGLIFAVARQLPMVDRYVRQGRWKSGDPLPLPHGLKGKTVGIFGFGRIGQAIASRLGVFGMTVHYYQPNVVAQAQVARVDSLKVLASESDYLVVCAPAKPSTTHVVNDEILAALGPAGTLVNISRGSLVDEDALVVALRQGRLGAAALDVFADEPQVPDALCPMDNVVLTPHVGSMTVETRRAMGRLVLDNLTAHFSDKPLLSLVR